jgi:hypothetical protein
MKAQSWLGRVVLAGAVLTALAAFSPRGADAKVYGLWRNANGDVACGSDCLQGQQCCEIKVLPAT